MNLSLICLLPFLLANFLSLQSVSASVMVLDDTGKTITLAQPAQHIVSLAPHITEMLFAAGAGDKVVGVVEYSDFPPAASTIPSVGSAMQLDLETLLALQPDLIVAWHNGNSKALVEKIETLGFKVFRSDPKQLEDIAADMEALGILAGTQATATQAAADFLAQLRDLRQRNRGKANVRVFYQIWHEPLMTVSGDHLISKAIELCGGENIFAGLSILAPQVSLESVLVANPQAIIVGGKSEERQKWLQYWLKWDTIAAVKEGSVFVIDPDIIQRHSPRITQGIEQLCGYLDQVRAGLNGAGKAKEGQQE